MPAGFSLVRRLDTADLDGFEPFGFRDGISQPFVEGLGKVGPASRPSAPESSCSATRTSTASRSKGRCCSRTAATSSSASCTRTSPGSGSSWTRRPAATTGAATPTRVSGSRPGWSGAGRAGAARPRPDGDDPRLAEANEFGYHEHDRRGVRCPVGSHIRRSNPRDSLDPAPARPGRSRSTGATASCGAGASTGRRCRPNRRWRRTTGRARPPLHLPQRQHRASVRVRPPHVAEQPKFGELYDDADPFFAPECSRSPPTASASA